MTLTTLPLIFVSTGNFESTSTHGSGLVCLSPNETRSFSLSYFKTTTVTLSPIENISEGWLTLPHDISVMWSNPSIPPKSMNTPYSVIFLIIPSIRLPSSIFSRVPVRICLRCSSKRILRERTMLPRFLFILIIFISNFSPINFSRLRMGRRSICDPGKKAFNPISTVTPPFAFAITVP